MSAVAAFDFAGCAVSVDTSDAADLEWLREFICPDFDTTTAAPQHRITLRRSDDEYRRLLDLGARSPERTAPCFALDGRIEALPVWNDPCPGTSDGSRDADGRMVVYSPALETFIVRSSPGGPFTLVARRTGAGPRVALLRAVREIASADLVARSRLVVHGAAFAWRGRGVLLAGARRSGKTTLLLHLLSTTGARLLANDRAAVWRAPGPVVRGVPTIVNVRADTLARLPALAPRFAASDDHHRFSIAESETRRPGESASAGGARSLTPAQLARLLRVDRASQVPLGAVLFPWRTEAAGGLTLTALEPDDAAGRLSRTLLRAGDATAAGYFTDGPTAIAPDSALGACQALTRDVPCFSCALGLDAYTGTSAAADVLGVL